MLRRYTWESQKKRLQHYKRRTPEASVLYQIAYHFRDELQFQWESRFQHQYGCLRDEVVKTLDEYLNCGILAHGAARVYCDGCKHSLLSAFSCKRRGVCPSCGAKRAVKFAEHIYSEVIEDVPHRHTVFTIPKRLRAFSKYDRKLNTILFRAAWGALSQVLGIDDRELAAIFHDKESEQFVARYIERAPSLWRSSQSKTTSSPIQPKTVPPMSSML